MHIIDYCGSCEAQSNDKLCCECLYILLKKYDDVMKPPYYEGDNK